MKVTLLTNIDIAVLMWICQPCPAETPRRSGSLITFARRQHMIPNRPVEVQPKPELAGIIPRAFRGNGPLQMLNPFAPPASGNAQENTVHDPDNAGRGAGIKLLSITF
jgi:hypothetical protein